MIDGTAPSTDRIDLLVEQLTPAERLALVAGQDLWSMPAVDRLGIPSVRVTDGPSGARGPRLPGIDGPPSTCTPCGSALGATWNPALLERVGALVGREARERGCRALLAPTVNLHRNPRGGRNFESYGEDPMLVGRLAAAYTRGVQSAGVVATVKHFVGNEQEHERSTLDVQVDERALRELYLVPFELAVREGGALGLMSSYNRMGGRWITERADLLEGVVRGEWGFEGFVLTDWFAVVDTATSLEVGLDLEMPGPGRAFGEPLRRAVEEGVVDERLVERAVRRVLGVWERVGALAEPTPIRPGPPSADATALVRSAAAEAIVLLSNDGTLPLDAQRLRTVALLGPNADAAQIMGGGSSEVRPHRLSSPLDELLDALGPDVEVVHERGCEVEPGDRPVGEPGLAGDGFEVEVFPGADLEGTPVGTLHLDELRYLTFDAPDGIPAQAPWSMRITGTVTAHEAGNHRLALRQHGAARVWFDDEVVLDGVADPPSTAGSGLLGLLGQELVTWVELDAGRPVEVVVELRATAPPAGAVQVAFTPPPYPDLLARAEHAAAAADVAVVVVGSSTDWESEMRDRATFALPGDQDLLVRRVAQANPRTVVVVNSGTAVDLSWSDEVAAVLQCWFGGEEMAAALCAVLTGAVEPGGRLPMSVPEHVEHSPSHDTFPGENGVARYGEGLFVGYRGHDHRRVPPRFPFGHGMGYTSFVIGAPAEATVEHRVGGTTTLVVPVENRGPRRGAEVVQCYVAPRAPRLARPPKELKAFAKVELEPGEAVTVALELDDRSFAYWDPGQADWPEVSTKAAGSPVVGAAPSERRAPGWQVDAGAYDVWIGRSSGDLAHVVSVQVVA
jgi:beta-glucosidase